VSNFYLNGKMYLYGYRKAVFIAISAQRFPTAGIILKIIWVEL